MKKNNNKGFSLVELIVVIAIMAVLVGVLAPSLLRYVEKSRAQKDASAIAEVIEAAKIACANETVAKDVVDGSTVTVKNGDIDSSVDALETEINNTITDASVSLTSKTYGSKTYTINISVTDGNITVADYADGNWS